jgi:HD-GYP domain-containing protein (c-di-GMP phosphodiesterase class II)
MEKKVSCEHLEIGMYISKLDRPWLETPFLIEGLLLNDKSELKKISDLCDYVYIDISRGIGAKHYEDDVDDIVPHNKFDNNLKLRQNKPRYQIKHSAENEMPKAALVFDTASKNVGSILDTLASGQSPDVSQVDDTVSPMIDSIIRNPDAMLWLTRLKNKNHSYYNRALSTCTLAIAFGRSLNLPRTDLKNIAAGALFLDIGMTNISEEILNKAEKLSIADTNELMRHVEYSVEAAKTIDGLHPDIIEIIQHHHERHNGSGYPNGLIGKNIPILARLVSIVDCYIEMTTDRPNQKTLSSYQVIHKLYAWRNIAFQHEVVEHFIQCLGPYPTGSMVELSTGEVGVVLSQNSTRSLRPRIMLVLSSDKKPYGDYSVIDLMTKIEDTNGDQLEITKGLDAGAYGINPQDYYI